MAMTGLALLALAAAVGLNDAKWIGGGATAFEKDFVVREGVRSATLSVTGLGYCEAHLDGRKIGDRVLEPSPTDYCRRILYTSYPLSLTPGRHTLRILLGHGWYDMRTHATWRFDLAPWRDRPKTVAALAVDYADGRREVVGTDASWQVVDGPIVYDCIREGEVVDGRKGWRRTGETATVVRPPAGRLEKADFPASRVVAEFAPQRIYRDSKGRTIAVFPKTVAGWVRLTMRGQRSGDVVSIRYDENLGPNGDAAESSEGDRKTADLPDRRKIDCFFVKSGAGDDVPGPRGMQTDRYVANGSGEEVFEPRFVYHGFRHAVIEGLRGSLAADDIRACLVRTDFPESGTFACSSPLLNELVEMARHSYLVNFANGFPTDCPHREKLGWCNDAWIVSEMAQLYFDNAPAYLKWIRDIADTQLANGLVCAIAPTCGKFGYEWGAGPLCGSIIGVLPYELWRFKGERRAVELAYPVLVRYLAYEKSKEVAPWVNEDGLGDWNANWALRKHSPSVAYVVTCLCMRLREIAAEFATVLGEQGAAERFRQEAQATRAVLRSRFRKAGGRWDNATQTAQAIAIMYRLCDGDAERREAGLRLVEAVEADGRHFNGGQVGTKYVYRALSEIGRADLALAMITNPTEPTMVKWTGGNGTLWEDFADGFSKAHVMLADFSAWAMEYVAGLREPLEPGCGRFLVAPVPVRRLDWAKATTKTPKGEFAAGWRRTEKGVLYSGEVPKGASATLKLPGEAPRELGPGRWEFLRSSLPQVGMGGGKASNGTMRLREAGVVNDVSRA